ncbi:PEGA domain-containing protein [Candidatus Roizmanbacteria bacterium]|nr:PEGA domain-containing protein [Candidatus Roizmanbacteria bacterium]
MKKKIGILLLLLLGFFLFVAIRFFLIDTQNTFGELRIVSSPNATVFINNVAIGKIPFDDKYKAGEYLLKLIPEENATQTASWQRKITVRKKSLTTVSVELGSNDISTTGDVFDVAKTDTAFGSDKGEVSVETEPTGAIVYLDNDEKGVAPAILSNISKGDHELSVLMPGFFRRTKKIVAVPGYRVNAYMKLAVDPVQSPTFKIVDTIKDATPSSNVPSTTPGKLTILVKGTPEGTLNVREDATVSASKSATVNEGDKFSVLEEKSGWYKIEYISGKQGWISSQYTKKQE